jgi:hypothetical protein
VEKSLHVRAALTCDGLWFVLCIFSDYRELKKRITAIKKGQETPYNGPVVGESPVEVLQSPIIILDSDACMNSA